MFLHSGHLSSPFVIPSGRKLSAPEIPVTKPQTSSVIFDGLDNRLSGIHWIQQVYFWKDSFHSSAHLSILFPMKTNSFTVINTLIYLFNCSLSLHLSSLLLFTPFIMEKPRNVFRSSVILIWVVCFSKNRSRKCLRGYSTTITNTWPMDAEVDCDWSQWPS